jgi:hypothetical protein
VSPAAGSEQPISPPPLLSAAACSEAAGRAGGSSRELAVTGRR